MSRTYGGRYNQRGFIPEAEKDTSDKIHSWQKSAEMREEIVSLFADHYKADRDYVSEEMMGGAYGGSANVSRYEGGGGYNHRRYESEAEREMRRVTFGADKRPLWQKTEAMRQEIDKLFADHYGSMAAGPVDAVNIHDQERNLNWTELGQQLRQKCSIKEERGVA